MQSSLQEFLLLGLIPGTNIQLSLEAFVVLLVATLIGIELARLYALHYYAIHAKRLRYKAEKLLAQYDLL